MLCWLSNGFLCLIKKFAFKSLRQGICSRGTPALELVQLCPYF
jgi:hypothetical protein